MEMGVYRHQWSMTTRLILKIIYNITLYKSIEKKFFVQYIFVFVKFIEQNVDKYWKIRKNIGKIRDVVP